MSKYFLKRSDARQWVPPLHTKSLDWMLIDKQSFPESKNIYMVYCEVKPGGEVEKHSHIKGHEEAVFVLSGHAKMEVGSDKFEVDPDTVVFIPSGVEHGWSVLGKESLKILVCICPPLSDYEQGSFRGN
jgi:quercetin dioxygenase-like cupin family protein